MIVSRKDILSAVELVGDQPEGASGVFRPKHKRYEIRAIRMRFGINLKWAKAGEFYNPKEK